MADARVLYQILNFKMVRHRRQRWRQRFAVCVRSSANSQTRNELLQDYCRHRIDLWCSRRIRRRGRNSAGQLFVHSLVCSAERVDTGNRRTRNIESTIAQKIIANASRPISCESFGLLWCAATKRRCEKCRRWFHWSIRGNRWRERDGYGEKERWSWRSQSHDKMSLMHSPLTVGARKTN